MSQFQQRSSTLARPPGCWCWSRSPRYWRGVCRVWRRFETTFRCMSNEEVATLEWQGLLPSCSTKHWKITTRARCPSDALYSFSGSVILNPVVSCAALWAPRGRIQESAERAVHLRAIGCACWRAGLPATLSSTGLTMAMQLGSHTWWRWWRRVWAIHSNFLKEWYFPVCRSFQVVGPLFAHEVLPAKALFVYCRQMRRMIQFLFIIVMKSFMLNWQNSSTGL